MPKIHTHCQNPAHSPTRSKTSPTIHLATGEEYGLSGTQNHWKEPLGKNPCIVDIDNRPFNKPHQFLHPSPLPWNKFHSYGSGVLNHYIYGIPIRKKRRERKKPRRTAKIHNYTYHFIRIGYAARPGTWSKTRGILKVLDNGPKYEVLVVVDSDAIFSNLHLSIEWLMNRWGVGRDTALALAKDPER